MTQSKHTPGPWFVGGTIQSHNKFNTSDVYAENQGEQYPIAMCFPQNHVKGQCNARFIVTACNSHYEMLEALEAMLDIADDELGKHDWLIDYDKVEKVFDKARAVIAKARGE